MFVKIFHFVGIFTTPQCATTTTTTTTTTIELWLRWNFRLSFCPSLNHHHHKSRDERVFGVSGSFFVCSAPREQLFRMEMPPVFIDDNFEQMDQNTETNSYWQCCVLIGPFQNWFQISWPNRANVFHDQAHPNSQCIIWKYDIRKFQVNKSKQRELSEV